MFDPGAFKEDMTTIDEQRTLVLDEVGVDGTVLLVHLMAQVITDKRAVYLISPCDPLPKFKLKFRKLGLPDVTLLEAQGKFKFSNTLPVNIDLKYTVLVHGASFLENSQLVDLYSLPNKTVIHLHKDIDMTCTKFMIGRSNLVYDMEKLQSGFSRQIFAKMHVYPGGEYSAKNHNGNYNISCSESSVQLIPIQ